MASVSRTFRIFRPTTVGTTIIALAAAIALLYYGRVFFVTFSAAVIFAFILEPFVGLLMRLHLPRSLASFVVCAVAICALYLVGLGAYTQLSGLSDELPKYAERIADITDQVLEKAESVERTVAERLLPKRTRDQQPPPPKPVRKKTRAAEQPQQPAQPAASGQVTEVRIRPERPPLVDFIYTHIRSVYETLLMASFVPFLVYFMLSWRDHIFRSFLQLFQEPGRVMAARTMDGIAGIVRAFVVGNFVLGLLLAAASTAVFWMFRLPYPFLVGPMSGFLSLVPYIGLPLAMIPPLLAMLAIYQSLTSYVIVLTIVALLHLVAMNLLYPKIVGPRVHLNPLVVTVALMFWSALWGAVGLVLAIPLTAGIKAVCDNVKRLQPVGRFLGD